jgi:hypothetical protein
MMAQKLQWEVEGRQVQLQVLQMGGSSRSSSNGNKQRGSVTATKQTMAQQLQWEVEERQARLQMLAFGRQQE